MEQPEARRIPEPEASLYWFSEGFTDYYSYVLLARAGILTADDVVARVNEVLRLYALSPARNAKEEQIVREFFTSEPVSKQPYWRGALLAMTWDGRIRRATDGKKSLDDVMRDLLARWKADSSVALTPETVDAAVRSYLGASILGDVDRYVVRGETFEPPADLLGTCFVREDVELPAFELGLDLEALKTKKISGVVAGSAAYAAGSARWAGRHPQEARLLERPYPRRRDHGRRRDGRADHRLPSSQRERADGAAVPTERRRMRRSIRSDVMPPPCDGDGLK